MDLTDPDSVNETPVAGPAEPDAVLSRPKLIRLLRAIRDAQASVLLGLVVIAGRNRLQDDGPSHGLPVAHVSGAELAALTGKPLRTVRHALTRLKASGSILNAGAEGGRRASYMILCFNDVHWSGGKLVVDRASAE